MIDLQRLRDHPDAMGASWSRRGLTVDVAALLAQDAEVRRLKTEAEGRQAQANSASKAIGAAAKAGGDIAAARAEAARLGDEAKALDAQRAQVEAELHAKLLELPNPVLAEVPDGRDAASNREVRRWGQPPSLPGKSLPHWEIAASLGLIDFERGSRLSGSGFVVYRGWGARLQRALINYFLDTLGGQGYIEHEPPVLVKREVLQGTGQLPKFSDQLFRCADDPLYLIPTAEVPLTNLHAGEILDAAALPLKFTAYTPCFRREAGAAGLGTRGITRMHQFDKVEMVQMVPPERSPAALDEMVETATGMLRALGLHHRVLELCAGDTGFGSRRTYDLEVWSPGTQSWLEVSSCSDCGDFQARRIPLKFRREAKGKPEYLHTLNGSGLALPRVLIGILESYLNADGSVTVPEVLRSRLGTDMIAQ